MKLRSIAAVLLALCLTLTAIVPAAATGAAPLSDGYDLVLATGITDGDKDVIAYEDTSVDSTIIYTYAPESVVKFYDFQTADGIEWGKSECGGWVNMEYVTLYDDPIDLSTITAKGMKNGVAWILYTDGTLSLTEDCTSNSLSGSWPAGWKDYADQIKAVRFEPGSIGYVNNSSFHNLPNLETVYVSSCPFSVHGIFHGCTNFTAYAVIDEANARYLAQDGLLLDKEVPGKLVNCPVGVKGVLELPEGITELDQWAFIGCDQLEEVILPEGLDSIGDWAFSDCTGLKTITFPASTRWLSGDIFLGCTSLETIYFEGDAPECASDVFGYTPPFGNYLEERNPADTRITATAYYPADNPTWTAEAMEALGGNITWVPLGDESEETPGIIALGTVSSSTGSLNVRSGPGTGYEKVGTLYNGDRVAIYEYQSGSGYTWGRITTGWIAMDYVTLDENVTVLDSGSWDESDADEITWTFDSAGTLTISGTGEMVDCRLVWIDSDGNPVWYRGWDKYIPYIRTVIIEEGITYVGDLSLLGAENLKTVIIADSVKGIGDEAFGFCTSLTRVCLGSGLEKTGIQVFENCESLVSFTFPNYDVDYGNDMFLNCINLKNITFPENMTTITGGMFNHCTALTSMVIPDTITTIRGRAFEECYNLTQITIPDSVTFIGDAAFRECNALTSVVIPGSVAEIPDYLFDHCDKLKSVTLSEGTTEMGSSVFSHCNVLTEITVPGSVSLMRHTFSGAYGTKTVRFLGHAPVFGNELFGGTTLKVYYPTNFASWTEDVRQQYGGTVTWVGYTSSYDPGDIRARGTCGEAVTWTLKNDGVLVIDGTGDMENYVTEMPWSTYASQITEIRINSGVTSISSNAFYELNNVEKVTIADTVTRILDRAFFRCYALKELTLPNGVTYIGKRAFNECTSLSSVTMGDTVTTIDDAAFLDCTSLSHVVLSAGLTTIEQQAFYGTALKEVVLPEGLTTIGPSSFAYTSITSVEIPDSVTDMGASAFCDTKLSSVTIGKGVTSLLFNTFANTPLTSVTIPANVESIEYSVFKNCTALTTVYFEGNAPAMKDSIFPGVTATVYYPAGNDTWTEDVMLDYGGDLTWKALDGEPEITYGDLNGDGKVNTLDLILLRRHLTGTDVAIDEAAADLSGDGKVNTLDLMILRRQLTGD